MTRKHIIITATLALLGAMPAVGQQIIQRMESDVPSARAQVAPLETAPLLDAEALKSIALTSRLPREVGRERGMLRRVPQRLIHKSRVAAQQDWEAAIRTIKEDGKEPDVDVLVNWVLHQVYIAHSEELGPLAARMAFREEQRAAALKEQAHLEGLKPSLEGENPRGNIVIRPLVLETEYRPGAVVVNVAEPMPATIDVVTAELKTLEDKLNTIGEDAQLANVDLQNNLQKQQQTFQMMSNVSKMLHDTAMAVIRKVGD